jgi:hypothetical protein
MFARICQIVAAVAVALLALLGIVLFPGLLLLWAVVASVIGGIVSTWSHILQPEAGTAMRVGAVVAAATMTLGLAVAGSIVLFGTATVWVVPSLLGIGGLIGWRHRWSWSAALAVLVNAKPAAAPPTTSPPTGRPAHGHTTQRTGGAHRGELTHAVPPLLAQLPSLKPSAMSTTQLCGVWQHSYWLLLDLPPGPSRDEVVRIRRQVLDELERRDPTGFSRWLQTEPRAGNHPGQYLIADN